MGEKKRVRKKSGSEKKEKKQKGSAFDYPVEGIIVPDDVVLKKNPNGTYSYYYPDGKKWKY